MATLNAYYIQLWLGFRTGLIEKIPKYGGVISTVHVCILKQKQFSTKKNVVVAPRLAFQMFDFTVCEFWENFSHWQVVNDLNFDYQDTLQKHNCLHTFLTVERLDPFDQSIHLQCALIVYVIATSNDYDFDHYSGRVQCCFYMNYLVSPFQSGC